MFDRLIYRTRQLFFALTAKMNDQDKALVRQYLDIKESALFFGLPEFEQKHSVVVAQKMVAESKGMHSIDQRKLIRLGLLHDIGKSAIRLAILDKVVLVVIHKFICPLYDFIAKRGESEDSATFVRQFYVHKYHGSIGAKMLKRIGESEDIVKEVALHDEPKASTDIYMTILDKADSE